MGTDKQRIIIILLIINAVLISYFGITIKKQINTKNDMLIGLVSDVNNSIAYLDDNISSRIKSELDERYNLVDVVDYRFKHIDSAGNKAVLDIDVKLKAVNSNSKIYLAYSEIDANNVQEAELAKKDGLTYGASIEMDLQKNYQVDVIERVDGGGQSVLNTHKQYIYLYDEFYRMRVQVHSSGSARSNEQIDYDFMFSVNDFGMDEFGLENVLLEVWYEDKVVDKIDITDSIMKYSYSIIGLKEHYNIAIASGQIDPDMSMEDFKKLIEFKSEEKNDSRTYYTYTHRINYSTDYPDLQLDRDKADAMHFSLIITCKDGYRFEW